LVGIPTVYFSVDVEASGPMPPEYNLVSIGAVAVRPSGNGHTIEEEFYVELKPIFPGFRPESMAVHGILREHLEKNGVEAKEAMQQFADWTHSCLKPEERPVFVGHNAVFDWAYINYYFHHFGIENLFGYKAIDQKSLAMGDPRNLLVGRQQGLSPRTDAGPRRALGGRVGT